MREIKFRAWDKQNNEWFEDFSSVGRSMENSYPYDILELKGGEAFELLQYTGLKDKNGREIMEGDYLLNKDWIADAGAYQEWETEVKWVDDEACFSGIAGEVVEVIGNIYEGKTR